MTDKRQARRRLRGLRRSVPDKAERAAALTARLRTWLAETDPGSRTDVIAAYAATPDEPSLDDWCEAARGEGRAVAFPTCLEGGGLAWTRIESTAEFTVGRHGLREPRADVAETPGRTVELVQIATVLVPGLGFSATGTRLGQGGGYYDRFLASWRSARPDGSAVGIAFDAQIVDTLPQDPHDAPVDVVITESRTIRCQA